MEKIAGMGLDPRAEGVVIICRHEQREQINILNLLFHLKRILVDNLPTESKRNQNGNQSDSGKDQHDVSEHLAKHAADSILAVVEVMNALHGAMRCNHVQRPEGEVEWRVFLLKAVAVLDVLAVVQNGQANENHEENCVENGQVVLVFAEVRSRIENL
jgi:hypothetical protein